jgi:hypothetical protein
VADRAIPKAGRLRSRVPLSWLRWTLGSVAGLVGARDLARACWLADHPDDVDDPRHPLNHADGDDFDAVRETFATEGLREAMARRREALDELGVVGSLTDRLRGLRLAETLETASRAVDLFNAAGIDLVCPFLDSRVLALAARLRPEDQASNPVEQALRRDLPADPARDQRPVEPPVLEWLAPGGQLHPLIERIDTLEGQERLGQRPTSFLFRWLCFNLWQRTHLGRVRTEETPILAPEPVRSDAA